MEGWRGWFFLGVVGGISAERAQPPRVTRSTPAFNVAAAAAAQRNGSCKYLMTLLAMM